MPLLKRLQFLLPRWRRAAERDIDDELRSIRAMAGPNELGNLTLAAEDARAELGWLRLEQTLNDVRYALRTLRKSPGFAIVGILSLAIGIGANTAIFTLIDAVMWRSLPVQHPETLFFLDQRPVGSAAPELGFSYQQYTLIRDHNDVVNLAAYSTVPLNVAISGHQEPNAQGQLVSGAYFSLLGISPAAGRLLGLEDDRVPMGHPVAVLSYGYWKRRFARDPAAIGSQISISGVPFTVVGVTPPEFFGVEVGTSPELFLPLMMQPAVIPVAENLLDDPHNFMTWLNVLARLKPGIAGPDALARLSRIAEVADWRPRDKSKGGTPVDVTLGFTSAATGLSDLRTQFSIPLRVLSALVALVLLLACANCGGLMLARGVARRSEFALRLALGARRGRLVRQVLVEGVILAILAGLCGAGLAYLATRLLVLYVSAGRTAVVLDLAPDSQVLVFTAAVSVVAGVLFAAAPALRASRVDAASFGRRDLSTSRASTAGVQPGRLLVIVQVALSLLLLAAAGLFVRSLQRLSAHQPPIDRAQVLVVRVEPRGSDQRGVPGTSARLDRIYRDLVARVERIPGVSAAGLARSAPLTPIGYAERFTLTSGQTVRIPTLMIYPHYLHAMGLSIVNGRDFGDADLRPDAPYGVVVNETFVREVLRGQPALGSGNGIMKPAGFSNGALPLNIIGVVADSPYPNLREAPGPIIYQTFLQTQTGRGQMVLHVRVSGDTSRVAPQVRDAVQSIDKDVPMFAVHSLEEEVDGALVRERLIATLSAFFGGVALLLVCIGLYGVISFSVSRRTAEIGVRMALGAERQGVAWMVARQSLVLVGSGLFLGLPTAWIASRLAEGSLASLLFEMAPTDPITIAGAAVVLVVVGLCAAWLPARRAARIDPAIALRAE
jgi:predicted permease